MHNATADVIEFRHNGTYHIDGDFVLDSLRQQALDSNAEAAEQSVVYYSDAHEIFDRYAAFEPDPEEIAPLLADHETGDWRKTMIVAASLTLAAYLDH